ncbi:MAG: helix-turn-helix domain-containing protein [Cyanophyceae cyanobacterium]
MSKQLPSITVDLLQEQSHQQVLGSSDRHFRVANEKFVIEHHRHPAHEIQHCSVFQAGVILNLGGTYNAEQWFDGKFTENQFEPGDLIVFPAEISHRVIWDRPIEFLMVGFSTSLLQQTTIELIGVDKFSANPAEIVPHNKLSDPLIHQIGLALTTEFQSNGTLSSLYAESMVKALLVHLLQRYSFHPYSPPELSNCLSPLKLKRVIEYIHENTAQNPSLAELAAIAQMSPNYFSRLFKQATGLSPHRYIIQQRLNTARKLLRTNLSITDIAEQAGFASQSHLTTAFRKHLSITPKKYREKL